jgi:hypothetical protein
MIYFQCLIPNEKLYMEYSKIAIGLMRYKENVSALKHALYVAVSIIQTTSPCYSRTNPEAIKIGHGKHSMLSGAVLTMFLHCRIINGLMTV